MRRIAGFSRRCSVRFTPCNLLVWIATGAEKNDKRAADSRQGESMHRLIIVAALALGLVACGGSQEQRAVAACEKAIGDKLKDKAFGLDHADMLAKLTKPEEGIMQIDSVVVLDKGLAAESKQTFECRVKFDPNNPSAEPAIVGLGFTW